MLVFFLSTFFSAVKDIICAVIAGVMMHADAFFACGISTPEEIQITESSNRRTLVELMCANDKENTTHLKVLYD